MSTPFLSICIPTYNRSTILKKTIESIISQKIFIETDFIELIISDNASTDETPLVAESFSKLFPQKIKYIRLDHPIDSHFNFENALKHGNGKFPQYALRFSHCQILIHWYSPSFFLDIVI